MADVETTIEFRLLKEACAYAASKIGDARVHDILERHRATEEAIGYVTSRTASFAICTTAVGDAYVPVDVCPCFGDSMLSGEGTSWILQLMPSQRRKTSWRAVAARANSEGWKCVQPARRAQGQRRYPSKQEGSPPARPEWRKGAGNGAGKSFRESRAMRKAE